jgi:hypothetical protein
MSQARFQVLFGPASLHPQRMDRPLSASIELGAPALRGIGQTAAATATILPVMAESVGRGDWYGWRLMGANNRELGRSALSFVSYQQARRAVTQLKDGMKRLVQHSTTDPTTGRWGWRLELDDLAVAVSSRWYERDHDGRLGAAKFVALTGEADLAEGVVTLHERRGAGIIRVPTRGLA